jgi:hypothetical protein
MMFPTAELLSALEFSPRIIVSMVHEAPVEIIKRRPSSGDWSIHEIACHLARVHPLFFYRLDLMLREDYPLIKPYNPGEDETPDALLSMDLEATLEQFVQERSRLLNRLRKLSPQEWARAAEHPEYARYSIFIMFRHLALHDQMHAYSIEELLLKKDW